MKKYFKLLNLRTAWFCICFALFVPGVYASDMLAQQLTLSLDNVSLETALNEITRQSNVNFAYSRQSIDLETKVSVHVRNQTLETALRQMLKESNIDFMVSGEKIYLFPTKKEKEAAPVDVKQQKQVKGLVVDETGQPLPGVSVVVEGTTIGTVTSANGDFTLDVPASAVTLVFSYIGYDAQRLSLEGMTFFNVTMKEVAIELEQVVVTALGIKKESKRLGYAVQEVKGEALTNVPSANVATTLTGKVAGLRVSTSPNLFDSPQIDLRGRTPVIVVDGVVQQSSQMWEIAPEDIENISVLKGPAAAVLYGNRGADGAIQITTKRGNKDGRGVEFNVSSATTFDAGLIKSPKVQSKYGTGYQGEYYCFKQGVTDDTTYDFWGAWGPEMDGRMIVQWNSPLDENGNPVPMPWIPRGKDNLTNFLRTGIVTNNNISFSSSFDKGDFRASFSQMYEQGKVPNTSLGGTTINLSGGLKLSEKLKLDAAVNYNKTYSSNYPSLGYGRSSYIYTMLLWVGANVDVRDLKDYWEPGKEDVQQRNFEGGYDYNNPYFVAYEYINGYYKDYITASASLNYDIIQGLKFTARAGNTSYFLEKTRKTPKSYNHDRLGNYYEYNEKMNDLNADAMLTYNKSFGDFGINAMGGGALRRYDYGWVEASTDGLDIPGWYNFANSSKPKTAKNKNVEQMEYSAYFNVDLNWKSYVYLGVTGRNDWSSTLSLEKNSYFYPSVSLSTIVSEYTPMPSWISYAKLRGSVAKVGRSFDPYYFSMPYTYEARWNDQLPMYYPGTIRAKGLKPSYSTGYEVGAEVRFLNNRLGLDVTYFNFVDGPETYNQKTSKSSGVNQVTLNGKETQRKGWEVVLNATPFKSPNGFTWNTNINWSMYRWYLTELAGDATRDGLVYVGDRYDMIQGSGYMYAPASAGAYAGKPIINSSGLMQTDNVKQNLGYYKPDFIFGFINNFRYKQFSATLNIDGSVGGKCISQYTQYLYAGGRHTKISDQDREDWYQKKKYVVEGVKVVSGTLERDNDGNVISDNRVFAPNDIATNYFDYIQRTNGYYAQNEKNVIDKTYLKLREISISYSLPQSVLQKTFLKGATIMLVGRNLFVLTKSDLIDPEMFLNNSWDNLQTPSFRNVGVNLNITF